MQTMPRNVYVAEKFGDRIRTLRRERGWTQQQLADKCDCTKRLIAYYETGGRYPPLPIISKLAKVFYMQIETLIDEDEPERVLHHDEPNLLESPEDRRLWKKFQVLKKLSRRDRDAVFRMIKGLETKIVE